MMKRQRPWSLFTLLVSSVAAQSHVGTEFWLAQLGTDCSAVYSTTIVNSVTTQPALVLVDVPTDRDLSVSIQVESMIHQDLPCNRRNPAVVRILADRPISVSLSIERDAALSSTLILPTIALDKEYRGRGRSLVVVAAEDLTTVIIGDETVRLRAGEAYAADSDVDTDWHVQGDKPLAVFAGSESTLEQLLPYSVQGTSYFLCPALPMDCEADNDCSGQENVFRYTALYPATTLTIQGAGELHTKVFLENTGDSYGLVTAEPHQVDADHAILVEQGSSNVMVEVPPIDQYLYRYQAIAPPFEAEHFVTLLQPVDATISLDGDELKLSRECRTVGKLGDVKYCCEQQSIPAGLHLIEGDEPFGLIMMGTSNKGVYRSLGGSGLEPLSKGCWTGGPYRTAVLTVPTGVKLNGQAFCRDGTDPKTIWATSDYEVDLDSLSGLETRAQISHFGTFDICLQVLCASESEPVECCSSISVLQAYCDAGGSYRMTVEGDVGTLTLQGGATCPDHSQPVTMWSSNDPELEIMEPGSLLAEVRASVDGVYNLCLQVQCGSEVNECCTKLRALPGAPSAMPPIDPSPVPSTRPSIPPSDQPSTSPSARPSVYHEPSTAPSRRPTNIPTVRPTTMHPTSVPSHRPSQQPSAIPSHSPSLMPSTIPSTTPSDLPSNTPSAIPSVSPSDQPTRTPRVRTKKDTKPNFRVRIRENRMDERVAARQYVKEQARRAPTRRRRRTTALPTLVRKDPVMNIFARCNKGESCFDKSDAAKDDKDAKDGKNGKGDDMDVKGDDKKGMRRLVYPNKGLK